MSGTVNTRVPSRNRSTAALVLAMATAITAMAVEARPSRADFTPAVLACRAAVGKSAAKLTRTVLKAVTTCHSTRSRDGAMAATDCNDIVTADVRSAVPTAQQKFVSTLTSPTGRCAGVAPSDALYTSCPSPCSSEVPSLATFDDVAACVVCLARDGIETFAQTIHGTPSSPLASDESRCVSTIGTASSRLFQVVMKDVTRCQALEESAGATSTDFCTEGAFPSHTVEDGAFDAENAVVERCALESFASLDSCADSQFGVAACVGEATLGAARQLVGQVLAMPFVTPTTTTTTTTLPPIVADPQCPDLGELVFYSHDSNIPCTTNSDCAPPRSCDASAGICVSLSDLDSGWTGHAHNSDLDDGVITRSRLLCPGPAPTCGECLIDGVDPSTDSCRCANNTRNVCDEPFAADADDCGGAVCDCYFGVPIPLSSAGTPACIVNRYSQDLTGTANVDDGSSSISARLRTRVYLGITTTNPCPVCGGTCSNDPLAVCVVDADCGTGNTCNQDTPNDGIRDGLCLDGNHNGLSCDVGGINPSFPAQSGAMPGGGGYSLDCMPSTGINISGAGLALNITQKTGTTTMAATLPCTGGNCFCKTCSATPSVPCSSNGECEGGSCAVSANFTCNANTDCASLDLGNCAGIGRCSAATSVQCSVNADCKNYTAGGPCQPSTCSALGGSGYPPQPNGCDGGSCSDAGDGEGLCTTGPDDKTCDGLLRANGRGILSCNTNSDCSANDPLNGNCTLVDRRACFLDPIVSTGIADTEFPVGAATFCVPPTSNGSINQIAGLPGPARVVNQGSSRTFCASDPLIEYQPGVGGCP